MAKQNSKNIFAEKFKKSIKKVENPKKKSLVFFIMLEIIVLVFLIAIMLLNDKKWYVNLNSASIIGVCFSILWLFLRLGLFQETRHKFFNWKNKKTAKQLDLKIKTEVSSKEYKNIISQQSYLGIIVLFSFNFLWFIITLILIYA